MAVTTGVLSAAVPLVLTIASQIQVLSIPLGQGAAAVRVQQSEPIGEAPVTTSGVGELPAKLLQPLNPTPQTQRDPSGWKMYRNEWFGFQLRYPEWLEAEFFDKGTTLYLYQRDYTTSSPYGSTLLTVGLYHAPVQSNFSILATMKYPLSRYAATHLTVAAREESEKLVTGWMVDRHQQIHVPIDDRVFLFDAPLEIDSEVLRGIVESFEILPGPAMRPWRLFLAPP